MDDRYDYFGGMRCNCTTFHVFFQDLVGLFGGIVGLCMGFSLLSGAELIYFFTIR